MRSVVLLSNCDGILRDTVMLPQGRQPIFQVARGASGFLSSHCMGIGHCLALRGESCGFS